MISRLDIKFVLTLIITSVLPMVISVHFAQKLVETSLHIGINKEMSSQLAMSVKAQKDHIKTIKRLQQMLLDQLVDSVRLHNVAITGDKTKIENVLKLFLKEDKSLKKITISGPSAKSVSVFQSHSNNKKKYKTIVKTARFSAGPFTTATLIFNVDMQILKNFKHAGKSVETFEALFKAPPRYLSNRLIGVYVLLLGSIIIISVLFGIFFTRKLTRRIHLLSTATLKVAAGDLSVKVEPGAMDEVGQLITAFNQMVNEIARTRAKIEYLQKISAWQEIAKRLAHEIKNPLTPIHLASQQLKSKYRGDDQAFKNLLNQSTEIIEEEVETLRRLVSDFSAFAKLPQVSASPTDLGEFLQSCKTSLLHLTEDKKFEIVLNIPEKSITVALDTTMMKRVVDNIIRNAFEALETASVEHPRLEITVTTHVHNNQREIVIRFKDNGPGIMPQHHLSIFDPYYTTKDEGTGLGLAISKKIVLEHGGRIWVETDNGAGATFIIILPDISQKS
jgi:nitrogen fixation/metabolism regulation signal transduction histidine kinase